MVGLGCGNNGVTILCWIFLPTAHNLSIILSVAQMDIAVAVSGEIRKLIRCLYLFARSS